MYFMSIPLDADQAGLTWTAQLKNPDGTDNGAPIVDQSYYTAIGDDYVFNYDRFPDDFVAGHVLFTANTGQQVEAIVYQSSAGSVPGEPTSLYTDYTAFIRRWGVKNVTEATQKDTKAAQPDWAMVQQAFVFADEEINSAFRGSLYAVPLDFTPWGGNVPASVVEWANVIAFAYCYDSRGFQEKNSVRNKVQQRLDWVYGNMNMYASGMRQLNAAAAVDHLGKQVSMESAAACPRRYTYIALYDGLPVRVS